MPGPRTFLLVTCLLLGALACSHTRPRARPRAAQPCAEVEPLSLLIDGAPLLNPGPDGQPLPTVVRVYQLRGGARFQAASLEEMLRETSRESSRNDRGAFADEVLEMQEVTLLPAGRLLPALRRNPQSTHVAITAWFRRPHASSWRVVVPVPASDPLHCYRDQPRWIQFFLREYDALAVPVPVSLPVLYQSASSS